MRAIRERLEQLIHSKEHDEALSLIQGLDQPERMSKEIRLLLSIVYFSMGQYYRSEKIAKELVWEERDNIEYLTNLGIVYLAQGNYYSAYCCFEYGKGLLNGQDDNGELEQICNWLREQNSNNKNVLMIGYYYPPLSGSGVFRTLKFTRYLPMERWVPTVISATKPPIGWEYRDDTLLKEIPYGVEVVRVDDPLQVQAGQNISPEQMQKMIDIISFTYGDDNEVINLIKQINDYSDSVGVLMSYFGGELFWAIPVIEEIEANKEKYIQGIDVLYTTAGPCSSHFVGGYLKKKYGIRWVADFRDEFINNPYANYKKNTLEYRIKYAYEQSILSLADKVIAISRAAVNNYQDTFSCPRDKVVAITNGYDEYDFEGLEYTKIKTDQFILIHTGLMYGDCRSPENIFIALSQLITEGLIEKEKLKFTITSQGTFDVMGMAQKYEMEEILTDLGYISHEESLRQCMQADLLVCLIGRDAKQKDVYTGKIFDYLRVGKPILTFVSSGGVVEELLEETKRGYRVDLDDVEKIAETILLEYHKWMESTGPIVMAQEKITKYARTSQTRQLANVFNEVIEPNRELPQMARENEGKFLLVVDAYPSEENPYPNMFVHKRVMEYRKQGLQPIVMICSGKSTSCRRYEDVLVIEGSREDLDWIIKKEQVSLICVHFLNPYQWSVLKQYANAKKILIWVHGWEIQPWWRRTFNLNTKEEMIWAKSYTENISVLWQDVFSKMKEGKQLQCIFVSQYFADEVMEDYQIQLDKKNYRIIHNFIDTELFNYVEKDVEQRKKILSIRSYSSQKYGNDLMVNAILHLAKQPWFNELEFRIIGDGKLFEELVLPLRNFSNVVIERRFLEQKEIVKLHKEYGVMLTPTRMDSQGVSRDEGMSSGVVPITNGVTAIPEFVDQESGILVEAEDYVAMADGIARLYHEPEVFQQLSLGAAQRVRKQSSKEFTIEKEIKLIQSSLLEIK